MLPESSACGYSATEAPQIGMQDLLPSDRAFLNENNINPFESGAVHNLRFGSNGMFAAAYNLLQTEFGSRGEYESEEMIRERLKRPAIISGSTGNEIRYHMVAISDDKNEVVAARDHVIIFPPSSADTSVPIVVHMLCAVVDPSCQRRGYAQMLRAIPLAHARKFAAARGVQGRPIVMVAEMDPHNDAEQASNRRRRSYGQAGFVTPSVVIPFSQPCLDNSSDGQLPIPLDLVFHFVDTNRDSISPPELKQIVDAMYDAYQMGAKPDAIELCRGIMRQYLNKFQGDIPLIQLNGPVTHDPLN